MTQGHHSMKTETCIESFKAVLAIGGTIVSAVTMNALVALATILYIALQAAYLIWKWRREAKHGG